MKQFSSFKVEEYRRRLVILRRLYDETQVQFAARLEIPFKRWNHYERGYPLPRETAMLLHERCPGITADWIWYGLEEHLPTGLRKRIKEIERELNRREIGPVPGLHIDPQRGNPPRKPKKK